MKRSKNEKMVDGALEGFFIYNIVKRAITVFIGIFFIAVGLLSDKPTEKKEDAARWLVILGVIFVVFGVVSIIAKIKKKDENEKILDEYDAMSRQRFEDYKAANHIDYRSSFETNMFAPDIKKEQSGLALFLVIFIVTVASSAIVPVLSGILIVVEATYVITHSVKSRNNLRGFFLVDTTDNGFTKDIYMIVPTIPKGKNAETSIVEYEKENRLYLSTISTYEELSRLPHGAEVWKVTEVSRLKKSKKKMTARIALKNMQTGVTEVKKRTLTNGYERFDNLVAEFTQKNN